MATKQQIGVVVSASGAKEYERQLKLLTQYTKEWKSETDKLTSAFEKNDKSMANSRKEREALEREIESLNKVLKLQQDRLAEVTSSLNGMPTDKQRMEISKLGQAVNETQTKINELKNRIKELPQESFFSRKEYITNTERLAHYTETLAAKVAMLDSAMALNGTTMGGINSKKQLLAAQIENLNKKLEVQKRRYRELADEMRRNPTDETKKDFYELGTEIYNTTAKINDLNREIKNLEKQNGFTVFMDALKEGTDKRGEYLKEIGTAMTRYFTVPIVAGAVASAKAFSDWETALKGVKKTTGMAGEELEQLGDGIKDMALETSFSSVELANVAEIAGQLGIRGSKSILEFTRIVSDLALATNLTAEDAATSLARIFNITEGGVKDSTLDELNKIGDVVVHLGNNMATSESEITAMANRMASAAHTAGLTTKEIFAVSAALSSVGITAEAGGSTIGQVLSKLDVDVAEWVKNGEGDLDRIAEISGMSAQEFADAWETEPVRAFEAFVTGLGNLSDENDNINIILDELSMAGIRESNMLKAMAEAQAEGVDSSHIFSRALELMEEAYSGVNAEGETFSALQQEADEAKDTSAVKFAELKESLVQLGQAIGEQLVPALIPLVEDLTDFIKGLSEMDEETLQSIVKMLALAAAFGPVIGGIGNLMIWIAKLKDAFGTLSGAQGVGKAIDALGGGAAAGGGAASKGGLLGSLKTTATTIGSKLAPALKTAAPLFAKFGGVAALAFGMFKRGEQQFESGQMDEYLMSNAAAAENVAKNLGWTEERVNQLGYTWTETGHLIALASQNMYNTSLEDGALMIDRTQELRDQLAQLPVDMATGITEGESKVQSAAFQIPMTGVEAMRPPVEEAYGYGAELAENFASGISSGTGSVESAVAGLADIVRSYIHFSEPDVGALSDFHTWMPDMMRQMAKGIDNNAYLVENAINRVADTLDYRYAMAASGGNQITINNRFALNAGMDQTSAMKFADFITDRVNENLGRMV